MVAEEAILGAAPADSIKRDDIRETSAMRTLCRRHVLVVACLATVVEFGPSSFLWSADPSQPTPAPAGRTPEEIALIQKIIASPEADEPRLALAKWLDDRDPARAEWIRLRPLG
jgi:uncharacterized protein (TIGR02996 family)